MKKLIRVVFILLLAALLLFCACAKKEQPEDTLIKTATIGDKSMDYLHFGNENGEKLVILPGLSLKSVMGSAEAIIAAYEPLARDYDVYLFDHIRIEPEGYRIADMAQDTLAAFDKLGIGKAHLMGVSMGGMVAQSIALAAPERVSSLTLCSTAMNNAHSDPSVFARWKAFAKERNTPALMEAFGESVYTPSFYEQNKDAIIASGDGATEQDYLNFLISLDAVTGFDLSGEVQRIACPAFVLGAAEDRVLGVKASLELAEKLESEYYIYEGYGHAAYDEAPDYLSRIAAFLKGE